MDSIQKLEVNWKLMILVVAAAGIAAVVSLLFFVSTKSAMASPIIHVAT